MGARILIIEDDPASLHLMVYLLKAFGYVPLSAQNGEDGLEATRREQPDLILCDIHLPKIDGYAIARAVKQHADLRSIPLVAVTAYAMVGDRDRTLAAGFDGYITKPIIPESFIRDVEAYLHSRLVEIKER
ncbi:MAG: response regulator [Chloroflexota bacterium]|jgi:CheY-like chemotaxis protein